MTEVDQSPRLKPGDFPEQALVNPDCPEEAFLWMFSGLPGMSGAPLPFPVEYLKQVSRRLWDCGARPMGSTVPPEQKIKYQRPMQTDPHWLTSPGVWVDINEPDRDQFDIKEFVSSLPQDAKRQLAEALGFDPVTALPPDQRMIEAYEGAGKPRTPQTGKPSRDGAYVTNEPVRDPGWNPCEHPVAEVLKYLEQADEDERERVLAIERYLSNKPRKTILDRFPEVA
ncbi:DUF2744 domain-containing protein [Nocardia higoensis]|uniref:DUF2744 domain-containing protein n=1 Tax=Nocardia higoensis TaxID=228599 RepID=A0ABS0DID6_9NOCA|nr:DUF2744 domain-containing protein [Nocardia higoensis]MBF6358212.1 DUF2744 domain-containing protein [Nocardia higoensis]